MTANLMGTDGIIVLVIAMIVLVGGSQLPKLARNVGMAGREFRKAQQEAEEDSEREKAAKAAQASTVLPPAALGPVASPAPVATPAAVPTAPVAAPAASAPAGSAEGTITLTQAQLDALLKAREEQARGQAPAT